jgi:hypothetical protein
VGVGLGTGGSVGVSVMVGLAVTGVLVGEGSCRRKKQLRKLCDNWNAKGASQPDDSYRDHANQSNVGSFRSIVMIHKRLSALRVYLSSFDGFSVGVSGIRVQLGPVIPGCAP